MLFPTRNAHAKFHHNNGDYGLINGSNRKKLVDGKLKCHHCDQFKELDKFCKNRTNHLGVAGICKECRKIERLRLG